MVGGENMIYLSDKKLKNGNTNIVTHFGEDVLKKLEFGDICVYIKQSESIWAIKKAPSPHTSWHWDYGYKAVLKTKIAEKVHGKRIEGEYEYGGKQYIIVSK